MTAFRRTILGSGGCTGNPVGAMSRIFKVGTLEGVTPAASIAHSDDLTELSRHVAAEAWPPDEAVVGELVSQLELSLARGLQKSDQVVAVFVPGAVVVRERLFRFFSKNGVTGGFFCKIKSWPSDLGAWFPERLEGVLDPERSKFSGVVRPRLAVPAFRPVEIGISSSLFRCKEDSGGNRLFATESFVNLAKEAPFESFDFGSGVDPIGSP